MRSIHPFLRVTWVLIAGLSFSLTCMNQVFSQALSSCTNSDFELNNFSNWNAETGTCCPISTSASGIVMGRHTIMSGTGTDPYSLGQIPVVCPGGTYSARLGNDNVGSEAEKLKFTFAVTANTDLFIYRYAVVLENPVAHTPAEQPRFQISVVDQNNQPVTCGTYNVVSSANIPGFFNNGDYRLKNWTTVGIELSAYIGQNVTIIFATGDCALGAHFGYAYIDCYCSPLIISTDLCPGANVVNLDAPVGFASYLWSGGQTTSAISISNPVIGTTYTVTMTSVTGCVVTLSTAITPTYAIAAFNTVSVCSNDAVFIDSSYSSSGAAITSWHWDFNDGETSSFQYPVHAFPAPGSYDVTLMVENSIGCHDTITQTINIEPVPTAEFAFADVCAGDPLFLSDQSTIATGAMNQWSWDFGDASAIDTTQNPSHAFPGPGNYTIRLISTGDNECSDTVFHSVEAYPSPVASYSAAQVCFNNPVIFQDHSVANAGYITDWHWDFGDNSGSTLPSPVHTYTTAVPFQVKLVVISNNGCTDTLTDVATVHPLPTAYFHHSNVCIDDSSRFVDLSSIPWGGLGYREWEFGDGTPVSYDQHSAHRYAAPGRYDVKLKSVSDFGCQNSITNEAIVYNRPQSSFVADVTEGCQPLPVNFTDFSHVQNGSINGWRWDFGDASANNHFSQPHHVFENEGLYAVTLTSVSTDGCRDSLTRNEYIRVYPKPEAGFSVMPGTPTMLFPVVSLYDEFSGATNWIYFFGDGDSTYANNPVHLYKAAGEYELFQIVKNQFQCFDTLVRKLRIEEDFTLFVPNSFTPNGDGKNDFFAASGFEVRSFRMDIFNRWGKLIYATDDITRSWDGKLNGIPVEEGVYVYSIIATDAFDVQHTFTGNVALIK